jgi:predicted transcriptional regulator
METVIELSDKQLEALNKLSKEHRRSKNALIVQAVEEYLEKNSSTDVELQVEIEMKPWHDDAHELAEIDELEQDLPEEVLEEWREFIKNDAKPAIYILGEGIITLTQ